jgi:tetratricopeptide (TPR) repeat protein
MQLTEVEKFGISGATLHGVQFLVGGSETGQDMAGVLGQNFLGLKDAEFDLANGVVRLIDENGCGSRVLTYWTKTATYGVAEILPSDLPRHTAESPAFVNNARIVVAFDTGAARSFLSTSAARRAGIDLHGPGVVDGGPIFGVGRHLVPSWIVPVDSFKVGGEEIRHTHLRVADLGWVEGDMLLGADFFLSHHVYVANAQSRVYFTYNGGPVFDLTQAAAAPPPSGAGPTASTVTPSDAASLGRRGAASASRGEFDAAIADLTHAIDLAPADPQWRKARAHAYLENSQVFLAMADLDEALRLSPGDVEVLLDRARLHLAGRDNPHALADLDAIDHAAPRQADVRLILAGLYGAAGAPAASLIQSDLWIAAHPDDGRFAEALNTRAYGRAQLNRDLDKALADADAALRRAPKNAAMLDTRGLVHLRRGEYDAAIADYDASLAQRAKSPWSLYGRGLAELRKGLAAEGRADLAAAGALAPDTAAGFREIGLTP